MAPSPTTTGIGGTVTSTAGNPLAGVSVVIRNGAGNPVRYASTDANGSYTATGLTGGGAYYVCFDGHYASGGTTSATGFAAECHNDRPWDGASGGPVPAGSTAVSVAANAITTVNASLAPGGGISGKVTTTTGSGIAGVWVTAYDASNGYYQGSATTSATGAYTFGRRPGSYVVCFSADNVSSLTGYLNECWNDAADQASATPVSVTGTSVVPTIDAQLTAGSVIAGQVTDGSRPIGGVQVTAFDAMGNAVTSGSTKLDGTFRVTGLRSAPYAVCVGGVSATGLSPTGYAPECYDNQPWDGVTPPATVTTVTPPVAGTSTVNVVLAAGGAIAGQVTDGTLPLPQARVTVSSAAGLWQQVSVGADGRYLVAGLPADTYTVCFDEVVTADTGHVEECWNNVPVTGAPTPVVVTAGSTTTANAALASAGGIGGQVTDTTGTPLGGYGSVSVYDTSGAFVVSSYVQDGQYLVTGLAPGSYVVCVRGTGFSGSSPTGYRSECHNDVVWSPGSPPPAGTTPVAVTAGSFQLVTLPLEPTPGVMGRVTAPDGTGIASVTVRLSASNSLTVATATTDSAGRYVVSAPVPGSYWLCFSTEYASGSSPSGYLPECWNDVAMPPGNLDPPAGAAALSVTGLTTADAQLAVGAGFTGTLSSDTPGLTIGWTNVSIYSNTGSYLQAVSANGSTYSVRGLPAGSYVICFDAYAPTGTAPAGGFRHECFNDAANTTTATAVTTSIGTVTTVNASLAPALAIVGTVSDSAGASLSGGDVYAFPTGGGGSFQGSWIDSQGHFVIGRLDAGTYTVCVDARMTSGTSATGYLSECFQDVAWDPAAGFVTPAGTTGVTTTSVTTPTTVNFVLAPQP
ncbi:MAG TPA: carboxypeptidase regulatory-like domain-containing protein [Dermatophilaceae bacterium]|nr:carboxypeptidase regulatory-like domain-containing protein [Dermatophilaceae bacterium]